MSENKAFENYMHNKNNAVILSVIKRISCRYFHDLPKDPNDPSFFSVLVNNIDTMIKQNYRIIQELGLLAELDQTAKDLGYMKEEL